MAFLQVMVLNVTNDLRWILLYLYVLAAFWILLRVLIVSGCFHNLYLHFVVYVAYILWDLSGRPTLLGREGRLKLGYR